MVFVILLMPMRILLAHVRIQKFKKYHKKRRNLTKNKVFSDANARMVNLSKAGRRRGSSALDATAAVLIRSRVAGVFVKLAAGGEPSTWSPPGRLVEHDSVKNDLLNKARSL